MNGQPCYNRNNVQSKLLCCQRQVFNAHNLADDEGHDSKGSVPDKDFLEIKTQEIKKKKAKYVPYYEN